MPYESFDREMLVVGSGAPGLSSAVTAASRALKVLVLDHLAGGAAAAGQ